MDQSLDVGDFSYFTSASDAPGSWRDAVEGLGTVGHSAASATARQHARSRVTCSDSFSPYNNPMRQVLLLFLLYR